MRGRLRLRPRCAPPPGRVDIANPSPAERLPHNTFTPSPVTEPPATVTAAARPRKRSVRGGAVPVLRPRRTEVYRRAPSCRDAAAEGPSRGGGAVARHQPIVFVVVVGVGVAAAAVVVAAVVLVLVGGGGGGGRGGSGRCRGGVSSSVGSNPFQVSQLRFKVLHLHYT